MRFRLRKGYTLIELLVVVTIIVILASLLMVAINKAIAKAGFVSCQNNLRQLGGMIQEYTLRNQGMLPEFTKYRWIGQLIAQTNYLEGGEFSDVPFSELPPERQEAMRRVYGELGIPVDEGGAYHNAFRREDNLFVCPTGKKQMLNLQGVRSSYSGLSVRDFQSVDSIEDPMRALLLFEYDANEVNIMYTDTGDNDADSDPELAYIIDTVQNPDAGQSIPVELYRVSLNHGDGDCGNVLFMDKHIECVKDEETLVMTWEEDYSTTSTTTSTSTTSTSTSSTSSTSVQTTTTPTTTIVIGGGGGGNDDPIIGGTSSITGDGDGTTTTVRRPGGGDDGPGATTSSTPTTSSSVSSTSVSTISTTSSSTIRRYLGPPF